MQPKVSCAFRSKFAVIKFQKATNVTNISLIPLENNYLCGGGSAYYYSVGCTTISDKCATNSSPVVIIDEKVALNEKYEISLSVTYFFNIKIILVLR